MQTMRALILKQPGQPLSADEIPRPQPGRCEVQIEVTACGVCRTDLHIVDGELPSYKLPLVPGHEIVGRVTAVGADVVGIALDDRVGVPWLNWTCGECAYCRGGQENLCDKARFTGYSVDGGYADYAVADSRYCLPIPPSYSCEAAAPLLCAGLIGFRALRMAANAQHIGLYGFGAAAHILIQLCVAQGRRVYAFVRPGDEATRTFALDLGAVWSGGSDTQPPHLLDAALIFAPVGNLVPAALRAVRKGGSVVCAGIHMSDIPSFPYELLWGERIVRSVANLTRADGAEFLTAIERFPIHTQIQTYDLLQANKALDDLRSGRVHGAAVLVPRR